MRQFGEEPVYPPNPAPYLTDWLYQIGPTTAGPMGESPMSLRHIASDLVVLGVAVLPWEANILRRLSIAHAAERQRARKRDCIAPYTGIQDDIVSNRDMVDKKVRALFRRKKAA